MTQLCRRQLTAVFLALCVVTASANPGARIRARRQLVEEDKLQPLEDDSLTDDSQTREKRKLEGFTQAKFGVKNAILGLVFGKINSIIDAKTRLVDTLDKQNIAKNKAYGIEAPASGLSSLGGVFSSIIGPKLQLIGPKLNAVTGLLGGASGGSSGGSGGSGGSDSSGESDGSAGGGSGLGSILSLVTSLSSSSGGSGGAGGGSGLGSILSLVTSLSGGSSGGGGGGGGTVDTISDSEEDDDDDDDAKPDASSE